MQCNEGAHLTEDRMKKSALATKADENGEEEEGEEPESISA